MAVFRDWWLASLLAALGFCVLAGCSRTFYRLDADNEVKGLIEQKSNNPRWVPPNYTINMDPRARFFDPGDPDWPPMPEDDPASHEYMEVVDGMRAWPHWDDYGVDRMIQNPQWRASLPSYVELTDKGEVVLNLDSAVCLAMMNSFNYRRQIEELYLSALDVSTERFRFITQFYGGTGPIYLHEGKNLTSNGLTNNQVTLLTDGEFQKEFATAGELVVGFANTFVWQFGSNTGNNTNTLLDFSFVQPLLRRGGRVVALEQLTIAERTLLANLRAFERYRQGFYTNVAVGGGNVAGPQRRGGFFGGTGLTGFTGQGSGGFGVVGDVTGFARGGFTSAGGGGGGAGTASGFAGGGAGNVGGFVGLLQTLQQIRNTRDNLHQQLRALDLLVANEEAGLIDSTQVDQFRQNIETERALLLQSEVGLENQCDTYRRDTLSLAPSLPMMLDDRMIEQFQLVDPHMTIWQDAVADFISERGRKVDAIVALIDVVEQLGEEPSGDLLGQVGDLNEVLNEAVVSLKRLTKADRDSLGGRLLDGLEHNALDPFADQLARLDRRVAMALLQSLDALPPEARERYQVTLAQCRIVLERLKQGDTIEGQQQSLADLDDLLPVLPSEVREALLKELPVLAPELADLQTQSRARLAPSVDELQRLAVEDMQRAFAQFAQLRAEVPARFQATRQDMQHMERAVPQRNQMMDAKQQEKFADERLQMVRSLTTLEDRVRAGDPETQVLRQQLNVHNIDGTSIRLVALARSLSDLLQELSLVQARARLEAVAIEPVDLTPEAALEIARVGRFDWMNNRAALVDTWRLIAFNANSLESDLTLDINATLGTQTNNAVSFRPANFAGAAALRFDPPFTRLLERNNYRQVLIDYQRDRRSLIEFEDSTNQSLRQDLRQLKQLSENLEIQRRAVAIAIRRVDLTREVLNEPPPPTVPGEPATQLGPTSALNLLTSLSDLRNTQNNFMSVWLNYYAQRMILMRDLGIMQIDPHGRWIDMPIWETVALVEDQYPLPPEIPLEWMRAVDAEAEQMRIEQLPVLKSEELPDPEPVPAPTDQEELPPGFPSPARRERNRVAANRPSTSVSPPRNDPPPAELTPARRLGARLLR